MAVVPTWVAPPPGQVADAHRIAAALAREAKFEAIAAVLDWVTSIGPTEDQAADYMDTCDATPRGDAARDTLAWLLGFQTIPPLRLPRRNSDGSVVTADELYTEYAARGSGLPEDSNAARVRADQEAALYRRLANLADHR